jgi:hypothetical protein
MKKCFAMLAIVMVALVWWPGLAAAAPQSFALPGHGTLLLNVPENWQSSLKQPAGGLPPTIKFGAKGGPPFVVLVTAQRGVRSRLLFSGDRPCA